MVPQQIRQEIEIKLNTRIIDFTPVSGGCISNGGKIATSRGVYFLKWNSAKKFPDMFRKEEKGLNILFETKTVAVPQVILTGEKENLQYIVMEMISDAPSSAQSWTQLGFQLALLHHHSHNDFGLDHDNYIGSLFQTNTFTKSWIDFFIRYRLAPQLKLLRDAGKVGGDFVQNIEALYPKLGELIPIESPALLHGDLWGGNIVIGKAGLHVIDPAVYFGHREAEISFTKLFGGFKRSFYDAYEQEYPLQPGLNDRMDLYNLYPLLVHANLFGQSYASRVASIVRKYV